MVHWHGVRLSFSNLHIYLTHISHNSYSGGKEKAPAIESDVNWTEFQRRLLIARRKEKTVFASIDTDILVPYKRHLHARVRTFNSHVTPCDRSLSVSQCHSALEMPFPRHRRYANL